MLGYLHGKRSGSKIAWANRKEGDRAGVGLSGETGCGGQWPTWRQRVRMWRKYGACQGERWNGRGQTFSRISTQTFSTPVILHTYPHIKMEQTDCFRMLAYKILMPGNYREESIQHSKHSKSLKSRIIHQQLLHQFPSFSVRLTGCISANSIPSCLLWISHRFSYNKKYIYSTFLKFQCQMSHLFYSYNKSQQDALFLKFISIKKSTCFRQVHCPSSGVPTLHSQQ
jgi:hypothetical protein